MSSSDMRSEVVKVTPAQAKKWLDKNHDSQRTIQWARVDAFTQDILRGAWKLTHQGICFDKDDKLIDGQHRLHAIVKADRPVELLVVWNARGEFMAPIDRGQPRSLALISGRSRREVATINLLRSFEVGYQIAQPITLEDVEQFGAHHQDALSIFQNIPGYGKLHAGAAAAVVYAIPLDPEKVCEYAKLVVTGEMLTKGDPALVFRRWQDNQRRVRPSNWELALATFNCLRYHLSGLRLNSIYTTDSGFRAVTSKRRKMRVPHTPGTNLVKGMAFKPTTGGDEDSDE